MRAHEILLEYNPNITDEYLAKVANLLQTDCAPYLKYGLATPFYRGTRTYLTDVTEFKTFKNRAPKDMPLEIHQFLDNWFKTKLGYNWRSAAVFAVGSEVESKQYGFPYIFVPIGEFDFCWSDSIGDLYTAVDAKLFNNGFASTFSYNEDDMVKMAPHLVKLLQTYKVNGSLSDAVHSKFEVLFNCESYYLMPPSVYHELSAKFNLF